MIPMEGTDSFTGNCYKKQKMLSSDEDNGLMAFDPSDDPLSVRNLAKNLDLGKFGSVSKYMNELREKKKKLLDAHYAIDGVIPDKYSAVQSKNVKKATTLAPITIINLDSDDDDNDDNDGSGAADEQFAPSEQHLCSSEHAYVNLDDEDEISENPFCLNHGVEFDKPIDNQWKEENYVEIQISRGEAYDDDEEGLYVETEDDLDIDDGSNAADNQFAPSELLICSPVHVFVNLEDEDEISEKPLCSKNGVKLKKLVDIQLQKEDYVETQIPRGKAYDDGEEARYIGTEDAMEIDEEDRQSEAYSDGAWNETTATLDCSKEHDYVETESLQEEADDDGEEEQGDENVDTEDGVESEEEDRQSSAYSDGMTGVWNEMAVALECSKDFSVNPLSGHEAVTKSDCEHLFILREDIGEVCRICGIVGRSIESIIEYNFSKVKGSTQTYRYETHKNVDEVGGFTDELKFSDNEFTVANMYPHPRHKRKMKPHQIEGFNFLASNLVAENPGGCIMAHAPGSGKTFMIISFLQSFMAKYPSARPLVVLPRGILETWKKEFLTWQVEDLPLYDLYSVKADGRSQQLQVLTNWAKTRSVLFLGYKQFSSIVCDCSTSKATKSCQEILLKCPTILILDEGHTPRNQETDILTSLENVQTPRKVVLSGTLYQNHVKEVFNILNLVRPRFLKLEASRTIKKRILSRAEISSTRNLLRTESEFYDLIEHTMLKDNNFTRKVNVIQDLREMTRKVLHYYKGDNLDELPGLVDFSVFLKLSPKQQDEVKELQKSGQRFKIIAEASAVYVHPQLRNFSRSSSKNSSAKDRVDEENVDSILEKSDVREGVKAKFFLNLLNLCESLGEKLLVFSQYLLPLKFLERLSAKEKGYRLDEEMFMITGDSNSNTRETSMEKFNNSPNARVLFGSIKACGEGISLVGASRIIILDVHLNPSVTRQAIGRAFRPGQTKKVYTYRLVASSSPEEDDHKTCFKKESIAKMWFEWDEFNERRNFEMESVDVKDCGDLLLEADQMNEDVVAVFKR